MDIEMCDGMPSNYHYTAGAAFPSPSLPKKPARSLDEILEKLEEEIPNGKI